MKAPMLVELSDWSRVENPTHELDSGDFVYVTAKNLDAPTVATVLERQDGDYPNERWLRTYSPDDVFPVWTDDPGTVIYRAHTVKVLGS